MANLQCSWPNTVANRHKTKNDRRYRHVSWRQGRLGQSTNSLRQYTSSHREGNLKGGGSLFTHPAAWRRSAVYLPVRRTQTGRRLWHLPPRDLSPPLRVTLYITTAFHLDTPSLRPDSRYVKQLDCTSRENHDVLSPLASILTKRSVSSASSR